MILLLSALPSGPSSMLSRMILLGIIHFSLIEAWKTSISSFSPVVTGLQLPSSCTFMRNERNYPSSTKSQLFHPSTNVWKGLSIVSATNSNAVESPTPQDKPPSDERPHEQRRTKPRTARRMNHSFQHLYRHALPSTLERKQDVSGYTVDEYLIEYGGYKRVEVDELLEEFPHLSKLHVDRHLKPKLRFIKYTLGGVEDSFDAATTISTNRNSLRFLQEYVHRLIRYSHDPTYHSYLLTLTTPLSSSAKKAFPPQILGARLEHTLAPFHAFLVYKGLPCGTQLMQDGGRLLHVFLGATRGSNEGKKFVALCQTWGAQDVTIEELEVFRTLFARGVLTAARNDMGDTSNDDNRWEFQNSGILMELLFSHGSNVRELDERGVSLLHWACGAGNQDGVLAIAAALGDGDDAATQSSQNLVQLMTHTRARRDGATPLHWAACGVEAKNMGSGGHLDLCQWILQTVGGNSDSGAMSSMVNAVTKDGNSVLMWSAWSQSFEVVKLLLEHGANVTLANRNGCTIAHWAASGGSLELCHYLYRYTKQTVDFTVKNHAGNTPLSHAVAYGRTDVVQWLQEEVYQSNDDLDLVQDQELAMELAQEFVSWSEHGDDESKRQEVLDMFVS